MPWCRTNRPPVAWCACARAAPSPPARTPDRPPETLPRACPARPGRRGTTASGRGWAGRGGCRWSRRRAPGPPAAAAARLASVRAGTPCPDAAPAPAACGTACRTSRPDWSRPAQPGSRSSWRCSGCHPLEPFPRESRCALDPRPTIAHRVRQSYPVFNPGRLPDSTWHFRGMRGARARRINGRSIARTSLRGALRRSP